MKNIYLYGASDDCHGIDTDFDSGFEGYGDIGINDIRAKYTYDGDWKIQLFGKLPANWKVKKIEGTSEFIHIQVPDNEKLEFKDLEDL